MGNRLSNEELLKSLSAAHNFRVENQGDKMKRVIVEENGEIIFDCDVQVTVVDRNIYYEVDIFWEDVCYDFRAKGLYGMYSSTYYMMKYEGNELIINSGDKVIRII